MLLGGEGNLQLGCAFTKLPALPPLQEGPRSLAVEAVNKPNEDEEKLHFIRHFNSQDRKSQRGFLPLLSLSSQRSIIHTYGLEGCQCQPLSQRLSNHLTKSRTDYFLYLVGVCLKQESSKVVHCYKNTLCLG